LDILSEHELPSIRAVDKVPGEELMDKGREPFESPIRVFDTHRGR
jgi:hypothetical protein